jgi:hypothetical protein
MSEEVDNIISNLQDAYYKGHILNNGSNMLHIFKYVDDVVDELPICGKILKCQVLNGIDYVDDDSWADEELYCCQCMSMLDPDIHGIDIVGDGEGKICLERT